jgi:hypothetical protein
MSLFAQRRGLVLLPSSVTENLYRFWLGNDETRFATRFDAAFWPLS